MAENRYPSTPSGSGIRETVCIDTHRVLDSCRDRDCFENVRVYLTGFGNEILERTGAIRAKSASVLWTYIGIDPIAFNRGFYAISIRFYVKVCLEACLGAGHAQELDGIAVLEKRVILYGGECNVSIYRSRYGENDNFCACPTPCEGEKNTPEAVVEVVSPVLLGCRIVERESECNCCCCCHEKDLPEPVLATLDAPLVFEDGKGSGRRFLTVSLGLFSVVRLVRPAQFLVSGVEYSIPEKECSPVNEDDPCSVFRDMPFPIAEFCAKGSCESAPHESGRRCGC